MKSCKRIPKPKYDSAEYSDLYELSKKRKKPPEPEPEPEPLLTYPTQCYHNRRKFPHLRKIPPAPPTPPLSSLPTPPLHSVPTPPISSPPTTDTEQIDTKEIQEMTNSMEITQDITSKPQITTDTETSTTTKTDETKGTTENNEEMKDAPATPLCIDLTCTEQLSNDEATSEPPPKKVHKTQEPTELTEPGTKRAEPTEPTTEPVEPAEPEPKPKDIKEPTQLQTPKEVVEPIRIITTKTYHTKFQNELLIQEAQTKHTKIGKAATNGKHATNGKQPTSEKQTTNEKSSPVKKPTTPKKDKGEPTTPKKGEPVTLPNKEEADADYTEKQYYKTETVAKKRPKSKLGNCVHCKKGADMESVIICDAGCGTWFHASCSGYPKPLRESEFTMALCKKCLQENDLTCKDIHYFEEEYDIIQDWCKENQWALQNIDNDGMCLFSSVFHWLDKDTKLSRNLYRVENLVKGVTRELQNMIKMNELPIIVEFKSHLMKDIQGVLRSSHNLVSLWNSHYEGLGIGDYFIAAIEKYLQVGICIYHVLDGAVCVRQKSDLYGTMCNVILRSEKYAAHYDLLLESNK